jgi:hypothetical protein
MGDQRRGIGNLRTIERDLRRFRRSFRLLLARSKPEQNGGAPVPHADVSPVGSP